jgi:hypothetical protein
MLYYNDKQQKPPLGGHQYSQSGNMMKAESFKDLVKDVTEFRIRNSIPVGRPDQDILQFYAEKWPWTVLSDGQPVPKDDENFSRWRSWLHKSWTSGPVKMRSATEAKERWKICIDCGWRKKVVSETSESKSLEGKSLILRHGQETPSLGFCSLHGIDLDVASFYAHTEHHRNTKEKGPDNCWV